MSSQTTPQSNFSVDPRQFLQIVVNSDGTVTRDPNRYPNCPPSPEPRSSTTVLSRDITINQQNNIWVRLFLPVSNSSFTSKLPLIVYFHGGGFINCSASSTVFHNFCSKMAFDVSAVVVSVNYRLSPEHRLPAAYDDAVEVLHWIKITKTDWLIRYADYNRCFIMGSSAGANIAYHAGLRVSKDFDLDFDPLKIGGLILHHLFIGGTQRTESELRLVNDSHLPQSVSDLMWELALPIGADREHEYCNPTAYVVSNILENIKLCGWRVLVIGCSGDPMIDRQMKFVEMMKARCVHVEGVFSEGGYHVVELTETPKAEALFVILNDFVRGLAG